MASSRLQCRPKGIVRLLLRLPIFLYRRHLGWLLGHRFLLLTHRGRKSGRIRRTVLEVVRFDPATRESIVVSAWGMRADRYRNIQAAPALKIQTGTECYVPVQRILSADEAYACLSAFERDHPIEAWILPHLLGIPYDGSDSAKRALVAAVRLVGFRPCPRPERSSVRPTSPHSQRAHPRSPVGRSSPSSRQGHPESSARPDRRSHPR